jgi:nucleotide-binding universal stress UspA family protein
MFEKILLAVDGSQSSEVATQTAIGFAAKTGASIEVVHVKEHDMIVSKAGSGPDLETGEEAGVLLSGVVDKLKNAGLMAHGSMRQAPTSRVAHEIIATADEAGADLIVVGSRGLSSCLWHAARQRVQQAGSSRRASRACRPRALASQQWRGVAARQLICRGLAGTSRLRLRSQDAGHRGIRCGD